MNFPLAIIRVYDCICFPDKAYESTRHVGIDSWKRVIHDVDLSILGWQITYYTTFENCGFSQSDKVFDRRQPDKQHAQ